MFTPIQIATQRFRVVAEQVLQAAVHGPASPLQVAVHQTVEPIPYDAARAARYEPVSVGWRWGPAWSTAWFEVTGTVPEAMAGRRVALRFSSGTEALLWTDGVPRQGFDRNRDSIVLFETAAAGDRVELLIEAACNHPFGVAVFSWDPPETAARWSSPTPGELKRCELVVLDEPIRRLWRLYDFTTRLLCELDHEDVGAQRLCEVMLTATRLIDHRDVAASCEAVTVMLTEGACGAS